MIPTDLLPLIATLEAFEAIRRRAVRLGDRLCDLSYANPYEGVAESTRAVLCEALHNKRLLDLQYSPFGGQLQARRAAADALSASHALSFGFEDLILTPGAMAGLHLALRAAGEAREEVVIPVPCWLDYPLYAQYLGLRPVLVPLTESAFELDHDAMSQAISANTCAVLLSHPANPTGNCYGPEALAMLGAVLQDAERKWGRTVTLIADETHRDFVAAAPYQSLAARWPTTLIVYSFGKYHLLQGQRLGYVAVSPNHPRRRAVADELVRWTRIMGFCTPTALMQRAIPGLLGLHHAHEWVTRWRARYTAELGAAGYVVAPANATYFLYVRTPQDRNDFDFLRQMSQAGVLGLPAPIFHHRGYFRLSLTGSEQMLERALVTLCRLVRA